VSFSEQILILESDLLEALDETADSIAERLIAMLENESALRKPETFSRVFVQDFSEEVRRQWQHKIRERRSAKETQRRELLAKQWRHGYAMYLLTFSGRHFEISPSSDDAAVFGFVGIALGACHADQMQMPLPFEKFREEA
jgi:hypothetical protein